MYWNSQLRHATTLRLHLLFTRCYDNVCRAGSLAVILQPAFVPFDRRATYSWSCLDVVPYLRALRNFADLRCACLAMFITLKHCPCDIFSRVLGERVALRKLFSVCAWFCSSSRPKSRSVVVASLVAWNSSAVPT